MTRIIYRTATTFTGHIADDAHSLQWLFDVPHDASTGGGHEAFMAGVGVVVQGSSTYEWVLREIGALADPTRWHEPRPTYVFSSRDHPVPQGADVRCVRGPVANHLDDIRQAAAGKDVWVVGGGDLAGQFADIGALDEIVLTVAPAALASGAPVLPRRIGADRLRLRGLQQQGQFAELRYELCSDQV